MSLILPRREIGILCLHRAMNVYNATCSKNHSECQFQDRSRRNTGKTDLWSVSSYVGESADRKCGKQKSMPPYSRTSMVSVPLGNLSGFIPAQVSRFLICPSDFPPRLLLIWTFSPNCMAYFWYVCETMDTLSAKDSLFIFVRRRMAENSHCSGSIQRL